MNVNELKPCPFCDVMPDMDKGIIHCHSCASDIFADDWQDRPIEDALRAEIANLNLEIYSWRAGAECDRAEINAANESNRAYIERIAELMDTIAALKAELTANRKDQE